MFMLAPRISVSGEPFCPSQNGEIAWTLIFLQHRGVFTYLNIGKQPWLSEGSIQHHRSQILIWLRRQRCGLPTGLLGNINRDTHIKLTSIPSTKTRFSLQPNLICMDCCRNFQGWRSVWDCLQTSVEKIFWTCEAVKVDGLNHGVDLEGSVQLSVKINPNPSL